MNNFVILDSLVIKNLLDMERVDVKNSNNTEKNFCSPTYLPYNA